MHLDSSLVIARHALLKPMRPPPSERRVNGKIEPLLNAPFPSLGFKIDDKVTIVFRVIVSDSDDTEELWCVFLE